jgi:hypothetical protein
MSRAKRTRVVTGWRRLLTAGADATPIRRQVRRARHDRVLAVAPEVRRASLETRRDGVALLGDGGASTQEGNDQNDNGERAHACDA